MVISLAGPARCARTGRAAARLVIFLGVGPDRPGPAPHRIRREVTEAARRAVTRGCAAANRGGRTGAQGATGSGVAGGEGGRSTLRDAVMFSLHPGD
ncbi:hypothetical protein DR950_13530 [Kitasatospora xanthocidica]|uniref:Uncharacterized protein n=1 Tax=Kitasatospora xanthocidica TaxID=83382 RepID=A0A372ZTR7_9ACTN|nr:hypothetical protein DR950_13530 [Kitasatospora xanthocidica]